MLDRGRQVGTRGQHGQLAAHVLLRPLARQHRGGAMLQDIGVAGLGPAHALGQAEQIGVAAVPQPQGQIGPDHGKALPQLLQGVLEARGIDCLSTHRVPAEPGPFLEFLKVNLTPAES
jgi:hypothetical protein